MNKQLVLDKIKLARQELSDAEGNVAKVLREVKVFPRADKSMISEELEAAFAKVKRVNEELVELQNLVETALK